MSALALTLLQRWWRPLAAGLAALLLLALVNQRAEERGRLAERQRWEARAARDLAAALAQSAARAATREAAHSAASRRAQAYAATARPIEHEVIRYVQTPAAHVACPDADGVRLGTASIAAANAALAAPR